ncbi:MAG TPA: ferredoxin [Candidatus Faecalibacterium intestinipullorum]|uniref:Ferredoxin n=1 Tax=Faecalibacterium gallinarum TaxID=2903556 RepID=A0AA37J0I2_9FIRM|nr:ferredoxin [Faecalibacterium gallinarum]GJN65707.1 ferredoxin [Faecalibacterium gallinarum]HIV49965.1 ferredoxin [Candidatus Faecalibacterium intestinipullorum]
MKAFVDPDTCIGCTQCAGLCPEVFSMEGSLAVAISGEIPGEAAPQAVQAAENCPVSAIRIDN